MGGLVPAVLATASNTSKLRGLVAVTLPELLQNTCNEKLKNAEVLDIC